MEKEKDWKGINEGLYNDFKETSKGQIRRKKRKELLGRYKEILGIDDKTIDIITAITNVLDIIIILVLGIIGTIFLIKIIF